MKKLMIVWLSLSLMACSDSEPEVITLQVKPETVTTHIFAKGELQATSSTKVAAPAMNSARIISWLAPNNSRVTQGDVVVRFDDFSFKQDKLAQNFQLNKLDIENEISQGKADVEAKDIEKGLKEVAHEKDMSESIDWDNEKVFSRADIIDSMQNIEYLQAKEGFYEWKFDQNEVRNQTNQQIMELKKKGYQIKYDAAEQALQKMQIKAPHDGLFVYTKNWSGQDPYVGKRVWPGMQIGSLPDLTQMQARMWIREQEASGLKEGLTVEVTLDAFPGRVIDGTVKHADKFAKAIDRDSPVKYIEILVEFPNLDTQQLRPGLKLSGKIITRELKDAFVLPSQAVYSEQQTTFVYKKQGEQFIKTAVEVGYRNSVVVEIIEGLAQGDTIALHKPGV